MRKQSNKFHSDQNISRRNFVKVGGAMIAGTTLNFPPVKNLIRKSEEETKKIIQ